MDDEGDFKKARGFLLTYSVLVLALWYFGADLTQFKLMGNEVQLHQRADSAWIVLAVVNIYLWFRFYQRVPFLGLYFDGPMNDLYDRSLVWIAVRLNRKVLKKRAAEHFAENYAPPLKMYINAYGGQTKIRGALEERGESNSNNVSNLHQASRTARTKMLLYADYLSIGRGEIKQLSGYGAIEYSPTAMITWPVKAFVIVRGTFVTPWFTDHIAPLVIGLISTSAALWKWYEMNFFTATLTQSALLCVK